ncbi:MAG: heme exporter protein CcmD [Gammaproteobacteria bacterium]|jgi:heme exporter protein D|nr:heme exporter protein CcmD [Gammaproteobacteria bacterium]
MTFMEFLNMGGYAVYVWSSVGLTVAVLIINVITARRAVSQELERLRKRYANEANTGASQ